MKRTYKLRTIQIVSQTWEYEFECDKDMDMYQALSFVRTHGIDGHCHNDDIVEQETADRLDKL